MSPFPGMDPYLEDPAIWPDVHQRLITYACDAIQERLPVRYYARMGERLYVEDPGREIVPDVVVHEFEGRRPASSLARAEADTPIIVVEPPIERREVWIEIRDSKRGDRVVTVIEVLSPTNKRRGEGRNLYVLKQREILESEVHLVEIDLLRGGAATVRLGEATQATSPYRVVVNRAPNRLRVEFYPIALASRLPRVRIPLVPPDPDVTLDLQAIFERAYEMGAFARTIDYGRDPDPPLGAEDSDWAKSRIATWRAANPERS